MSELSREEKLVRCFVVRNAGYGACSYAIIGNMMLYHYLVKAFRDVSFDAVVNMFTVGGSVVITVLGAEKDSATIEDAVMKLYFGAEGV